MPKLEWDKIGERFYETGVSRGVLYVQSSTGTYPEGVAWNGLTAVNESPSGGESNWQYADNIRYLNLRSREEFNGTIEAFTYPDEFEVCDGSVDLVPGVIAGQQSRKPFGFCYRTEIGNDTEGDSFGYKIHLVYNATVSPSEKSRSTINDSPEATSLSWEFETSPIEINTLIDGKKLKPVAHIVIDSRDFTSSAARAKLDAFEEVLYGRNAVEGDNAVTDVVASLPLPDAVIAALTVNG